MERKAIETEASKSKNAMQVVMETAGSEEWGYCGNDGQVGLILSENSELFRSLASKFGLNMNRRSLPC